MEYLWLFLSPQELHFSPLKRVKSRTSSLVVQEKLKALFFRNTYRKVLLILGKERICDIYENKSREPANALF